MRLPTRRLTGPRILRMESERDRLIEALRERDRVKDSSSVTYPVSMFGPVKKPSQRAVSDYYWFVNRGYRWNGPPSGGLTRPDPNRVGPGAPFLAGHILALLGERETPEQFCGRTDLEPHRPHSWARLPDGSYGDYDDEGRTMVWCPGTAAA